jgi:ribonuclease T2
VRRTVFAALIALLPLALAGYAAARHHGGEAQGAATPGDFEYYVLSLSWSPAYCLDSPQSAECQGPRRYGFIVHGLWPQSAEKSPQHCDFPRQVPEDVVQGIVDLMPARGLIYHEWSAHGTCTGLEPAAFFALVRRAYSEVVIPQQLLDISNAVEQPTAAIAGAILRANPRLPPAALVVTCSRQGAPRLREVRLCLDRELAPRACSRNVARAGCRAPELIVPPIR